MGDRAAAVEQAGGREQERAAADRDAVRAASPERAGSTRPAAVLAGGVDAPSARNDQRVERDFAWRQRRRLEHEAGRGPDLRRRGNDHRLIGGLPAGQLEEVVGGRKHLQRPGHVEQLGIGIGEDFDAAHTVGMKRGMIGDRAKQ